MKINSRKGGLTKLQKEKRFSYKKFFQRMFFTCLLFLFGAILFLKFDTSAAAVFTDNVLRPILGADKVIFLEKVFFNLSDKIQRFTYSKNYAASPQFADQNLENNLANTNLDLTPLETNKNFAHAEKEGIWQNRPLAVFPNKEVMAYSFVRSDPERPYSTTTLVQLDMHNLGIQSVAGIKEPGGPAGKPGPGVIPQKIIDSGNLIAAFDGGFQYKDGAYGMIVENTTYLPLKNDLGTFIGYHDGSMKIIDYQGQNLGNNVAFIRQNCPILINNGEITVENPRSKALWGRLASGTTDIFTWRSGIGLNKNGNLIFAVGNNLTPVTLAKALKTAGAIDAIQLDINPTWVRFNIFDSLGGGKYKSTPLNKQLYDGTSGYLDGYNKDFFYIYKK